MNIKNKLLIPLIVVSLASLMVSGSIGGVLISKQINYTKLSASYDKLWGDFENQLGVYEDLAINYEDLLSEMEQLSATYQILLNTYNILVDDNSDLQEDYDNLLLGYNLLLTNYDTLYISYTNLQDSYNNLQNDYNDLQNDYDDLTTNFNNLQSAYDSLSALYNTLLSDYNTLVIEHSLLETDFTNLQYQYDLLQDYADSLEVEISVLKNYIQTLILPLQYSVFAEAVRRYYMPLYIGSKTGKDEYLSYAEFARDMILHDSYQENSFTNVSSAFSDCLEFGNDTMNLAWYIMYWTFWDWLPNWDGFGLGNDLSDIDTVVQWCIDEINYEYDSDITDGQDFFVYDYFKFPVETAFRTMGDCDDQAIFAATYLESCGFETAIVLSHDDNHPVYGEFYHASLFVHIEQTALFNFLYPANLWNIGSADPYEGYTWCWLDTTWDIPFGDRISWVDDYIDAGIPINDEIATFAICDVGGTIE